MCVNNNNKNSLSLYPPGRLCLHALLHPPQAGCELIQCGGLQRVQLLTVVVDRKVELGAVDAPRANSGAVVRSCGGHLVLVSAEVDVAAVDLDLRLPAGGLRVPRDAAKRRGAGVLGGKAGGAATPRFGIARGWAAGAVARWARFGCQWRQGGGGVKRRQRGAGGDHVCASGIDGLAGHEARWCGHGEGGREGHHGHLGDVLPHHVAVVCPLVDADHVVSQALTGLAFPCGGPNVAVSQGVRGVNGIH